VAASLDFRVTWRRANIQNETETNKQTSKQTNKQANKETKEIDRLKKQSLLLVGSCGQQWSGA
jgi:hypothetical protein